MEYMPKDKTAVPPPTEYLPQHIGIIMDGNGRWAKARGLAREYGHRRGSEVFMDIARYCKKIGIRYLTVYAFSTENWKANGSKSIAWMTVSSISKKKSVCVSSVTAPA